MTSETSARPGPDAAALRTALDSVYDEVIADLTTLVAIPSIAWPTEDPENVESSAREVARLAEASGFETVEILRGTTPSDTPGHPAVVASIPAPEGAPTVVLYAHHDVQPTGDLTAWETEPFVLTRRGDRLHGRGAADDKAGILVHLTAVRLLRERLGVGVTLFVEGEEEAGSPSFRNFLDTHREKLAGDVFVIADSGNWAAGVPALTSSLRGLVALEFTLTTLDHAVHSGMYGGVVPDAMMAMTRLLATLHDEAGDVAVAGLTRLPDPAADYTEAEIRRDSGVLDTTELIGTGNLTSRTWTKPSLTVIGLDVPDVDGSSNTLQASMRAKISVRIAPGDDPQRALAAIEKHLEKNVPFGARLEIGAVETGGSWQADPHDPNVETAREVLSEAFGADCVSMGLGGSIPFIADLLELYPQASILVTGVEDPDARAHSANESLYEPDFRAAIVAEALLLSRLGR